MTRSIITGSSGFIGKYVVRNLVTRGHEVHCLNRTPVVNDSTMVCHPINLLTEGGALGGLLKEIKPQNLIHLAWSVEPGKFWNSRTNLDWFSATLNLYRAFAAAGGERIVLAGTSAEYDWSTANTIDPLDELLSVRAPATLYGKVKHSLFNLLSSAASLDNISLASGRMFFLYGPTEKPGRLVSDTISNLLRNKPMEATSCTQSYDFMHVEDAAGAFAALLDSTVNGAVNIASGTDQPLHQILQNIGNQIGRADLIQFGARPSPENTPERLAASVTRLRDEVRFIPKFDLHSGLSDAINWWRMNLDQEFSL